MIGNLLKGIALGALAITMPFSVSAWDFASDELIYSYSNETGLKAFGTSRAETYDVAIHLPDKALVGKKVTGVRIPFTGIKDLSNFSVWMTTELGIDQNDFVTNIINICSQKAELTNDQYVEVKFNEPYTITDEGVYVGYSFTVDKAKDQSLTPIWCTTVNTDQEGFYIHSSYTFRRWVPRVDEMGMNLAMQVIISGVDENAAGLGSVKVEKPSVTKNVEVKVALQNHGSQPVKSFEYAYSFGDNKGTRTVDVPAIEAITKQRKYNTTYNCSLSLPPVEEKGEYPFSLEITKVNGVANKDLASKYEGNVNVASKVAKKIPVLEEYTGGWCGNCTRGIASLNRMTETCEDFIGIAYHNNDGMEVLAQREFPEGVGGYPYARFDRTYDTDPYYGKRADSKYGLDWHWIEVSQNNAPADIEVTTEWDGDEKKELKVKSKVTFMDDDDLCLYTLAYVLLHDGMTGRGSNWQQSNYYVGNSNFIGDPYMDQFVYGSDHLYPVYNDVMVACSEIKGIPNSLPREVKAEVPVEHEYVFKMDNVKNTSGQTLIQDKNKLRVAVLLIGANKRIANGGKAFAPDYDGEALHAVGKGNPTEGWVPLPGQPSHGDDPKDPDAVDTINGEAVTVAGYYDLTGQEVKNPANGIYIVKMSDGTTRKIVVCK